MTASTHCNGIMILVIKKFEGENIFQIIFRLFHVFCLVRRGLNVQSDFYEKIIYIKVSHVYKIIVDGTG